MSDVSVNERPKLGRDARLRGLAALLSRRSANAAYRHDWARHDALEARLSAVIDDMLQRERQSTNVPVDRTWYFTAYEEYVARCNVCQAQQIASSKADLDRMSQRHANEEHRA